MLRVGINAAPLVAPRTGVGRYIARLLESLSALESGDVRFVPLFAPKAAIDGVAAPTLRAASMVRRLLKRLPGGYDFAQAARAAALVAHRDLDLYHETNHAAPRFRGPVVLTVHDLSTLRFPETQEPARARYFARALRDQAPRAARIATAAEAIASEIVDRLGARPDRIRVIPHGVDPRFSPAGARAQRSRPYALYVGALNARKGLPTLLAAFAALPERIRREHELVIAGPREHGVSDLPGATLLGYVQDAELPALLRGASAFCYPSLYEGFGLPLLEAMACGVPCVASDDPALMEVAAGAALHAPRGDVEAFAGALERALDDEPTRADLSRRGPERAAGFTWEKSAREHLRLYREALA